MTGADPKKQRILECALKLLTEHGDAGLTMRRIADCASMSLGNLQYHFKTRDDVLSSMVEMHFVECSRELMAETKRLRARTPRGRARHLILMALRHGEEISDVCRCFRELWAISSRNEHVRNQMRTYYTGFSTVLADAVLGPAADRAAHDRLRTLLLPYFEGYSITAPSLPMSIDETANMLTDIAIALVKEEDPR